MSSVRQLINIILWMNFICGIFLSFDLDSEQNDVICMDDIKCIKVDDSKLQEGEDTEQLINISETMPSYIPGEDSLLHHVYSNLKWPRGFCGEGTVIITFVIDKNGIAKDHNITRGIYEKADQEALRVVKLLQKWHPAKRMGKLIDIKYNIPVRFILE